MRLQHLIERISQQLPSAVQAAEREGSTLASGNVSTRDGFIHLYFTPDGEVEVTCGHNTHTGRQVSINLCYYIEDTIRDLAVQAWQESRREPGTASRAA